jgi:hypothetical protein
MAAVLELGAIADGGNDRRGGLGTNAFDLGDALTVFAVTENCVDLLVEGRDPPIKIPEQVVKLGDRGPWRSAHCLDPPRSRGPRAALL